MKKHVIMVGLLVCVLLFTGCRGENDIQNTTDSVQENDGEGEKGAGDELQYTDKVFDKTLMEGKTAVWFFKGDYEYVDYASQSQASGDATLLVAPDGTTVLIDFSNMVNGAYVAEKLQELGIERLDYVILTNPGMEHVGGYGIIMRYMEIGQIYTNANTGDGTYKMFAEEAASREIPITVLKGGDTLELGSKLQAEVFHPLDSYKKWSSEEGQKNGSLVIKLTCGQASFLFGGDISKETEESLVEMYGDRLQADVVRMNAHGDKDSSSKAWVNAVKAKVVCGQMSLAPSEAVMGRWVLGKAVTLHTALDGSCVVYTDGDGSYKVQVEKDRDNEQFIPLDTVEGLVVYGN